MTNRDDYIVTAHISMIRSSLDTIILSYDALIRYVQAFGDADHVRELENQRLCIQAFVTSLEQQHED
jgi:hypothetical protein